MSTTAPALMPVRIAAGALGEASPSRDLFVSPEHMMCFDDVLVPAEKLLNGTTITRCENVEVVKYFHVELPRHSVIYAEGAPSESFLDTGNRNMFSNVLDYLRARPCSGQPRTGAVPACGGRGRCARGGTAPALPNARGRAGLAAAKVARLHLLVDGAPLRPETEDTGVVRFAVPAGAHQVRIVSRSVVPADIDPTNGDRRRLGVCLRGLSLRDGSFSLEVRPGCAVLQTGFHNPEENRRWTTGDAVLPEELYAALPEGFTLQLSLVQTSIRYPALPKAHGCSTLPDRLSESDLQHLRVGNVGIAPGGPLLRRAGCCCG